MRSPLFALGVLVGFGTVSNAAPNLFGGWWCGRFSACLFVSSLQYFSAALSRLQVHL